MNFWVNYKFALFNLNQSHPLHFYGSSGFLTHSILYHECTYALGQRKQFGGCKMEGNDLKAFVTEIKNKLMDSVLYVAVLIAM